MCRVTVQVRFTLDQIKISEEKIENIKGKKNNNKSGGT